MPQDRAVLPAPPPELTGLIGRVGLILLVLVLLFGGVQLWFWTDRGIWIDEISQLLNYPLSSLSEAFGPLPQAQQAAPPLFNLLLHAISDLPIQALRVVMVGLTLAGLLAALLVAFGPSRLPIAAGLLVLLSLESFLLNATMLKFYTFEIVGFAIFTGWLWVRDRAVELSLRDIAILLAGMLMGISTIVGACMAMAVFLGLRLARHGVRASELWLAALLVFAALGYFLQIRYATGIQISSFPDAYGRTGLDAAWPFLKSAYGLFLISGGLVLAVIAVLTMLAAGLLRGAERAQIAGPVVFGFSVVAVFLVLAAIGKYPASTSRHLVWALGIYSVLTSAVVAALLTALNGPRHALAACGLTILGLSLTASAVHVAMQWPPRTVEGAGARLTKTLAELPPSTVLTYYGALRLVPLALERGAPIGKHDYAPDLSIASGEIMPSYFGPEWQDMEADTFSERGESLLRNDPLGWAKMLTLMRLRMDSRPLARFVLDAAPTDGSPFHIAAIHVAWDSHERATALRTVLEERDCRYWPIVIHGTPLSPAFLLEASCP